MPRHNPLRPPRRGPVVLLLAALALAAAHPATAAGQPAATPERADRAQRTQRILQRAPDADTDGDGALSDAELRAFMQQRRAARGDTPPRSGEPRRANASAPPPTEADLAYGDHERHRIDLYLPPDAADPTPLVVFIHGGGFVGGDKRQVSSTLIAAMHRSGIAVAAINYRYCTTDPLPAAMHDGARALQYLRAHADRFNLDPEHVAVTGGSAGAGIALWIALHDDLADPDSDDPVARQSTRVSAAVVQQAQISYDPRDWITLGLERGLDHRPFPVLHGYDAQTPFDDPGLAATAQASSPLALLTADDPPLRFDYRAGPRIDDATPMGDLIHHPNHGLAMQRACQPLGVPCEVHHGDSPRPAESTEDFLIRHLRAR